jgi:hypothetical protein
MDSLKYLEEVVPAKNNIYNYLCKFGYYFECDYNMKIQTGKPS